MIDNMIGTNIIFKMIGLILGIIAGFYSDYKIIKNVLSDNNDTR